ncbi:MAG TPA: hypothetical protein VF042_17160 [Gemmatimonadaceae bacterium]
MPIVDFESLPASSRIWIYGSDGELSPDAEKKLLDSVDEFLARWAAHGVPLHNARRWDDGRFLTIGVDSTKEGASGCSIDGLFRTLKSIEPSLGAHIVTSGLVYYRDRDGNIQSVTRDEFSERAAKGEISGDTEVFDLSITSLEEWQSRFRSRAADSWHAALIPETSAKS